MDMQALNDEVVAAEAALDRESAVLREALQEIHGHEQARAEFARMVSEREAMIASAHEEGRRARQEAAEAVSRAQGCQDTIADLAPLLAAWMLEGGDVHGAVTRLVGALAEAEHERDEAFASLGGGVDPTVVE